jgi:RecA-family ATPase
MLDEVQNRRRPVVVRLDEVCARPVDWLWEGWLARGKFHLMEGWPGLGKTTLLIDLMARLTTGQALPGDTAGRPPLNVGLLTAEDDLGDTVSVALCLQTNTPGCKSRRGS